ncbi:C-C motif chemokine 17-like [Varanus komodoensis]|uniref:C-C motif chemokine 17-like n=1 Tax=Varanus komodoensis TaxID=61221 RepID=UPI001CF790B1|nr:C-C motif chemokine 17-like [Varanus komodoensis]
MASLKTTLLMALILAVFYQQIEATCVTCPKECCFDVKKGLPIPRRNLDFYYKTSSECHLKAVVLVNKKGIPICANPQMSWVKKAMTVLPHKMNSS